MKKQKDVVTLQSSNKFEVLRSRVMNKGEESERVERRKMENKRINMQKEITVKTLLNSGTT